MDDLVKASVVSCAIDRLYESFDQHEASRGKQTASIFRRAAARATDGDLAKLFDDIA